MHIESPISHLLVTMLARCNSLVSVASKASHGCQLPTTLPEFTIGHYDCLPPPPEETIDRQCMGKSPNDHYPSKRCDKRLHHKRLPAEASSAGAHPLGRHKTCGGSPFGLFPSSPSAFIVSCVCWPAWVGEVGMGCRLQASSTNIGQEGYSKGGVLSCTG